MAAGENEKESSNQTINLYSVIYLNNYAVDSGCEAESGRPRDKEVPNNRTISYLADAINVTHHH